MASLQSDEVQFMKTAYQPGLAWGWLYNDSPGTMQGMQLGNEDADHAVLN